MQMNLPPYFKDNNNKKVFFSYLLGILVTAIQKFNELNIVFSVKLRISTVSTNLVQFKKNIYVLIVHGFS